MLSWSGTEAGILARSKGSLVMRKLIILCAFVLGIAPVSAQTPAGMPQELKAKIDGIANEVLKATGVPSASIAVVEDGRIAYVEAYGSARLEPKLAATPALRYSIGSISKQFTAAAILMLQERGKLSVDDPVGKYVPGLTRGNEVTIRQVLSHTSGYSDFWPQDYVPPMMLKSITPQEILDRWAKRPLDFEPGTKWQYSNTNFVIAGLIVQKAGGVPLWQLLEERVFKPLDMKSVTNTDERELPATDPKGYFRYALGPLRPAPKEGVGWMYAAGELAMTPEDLAKWDVALIRREIMKPESYREFAREVQLKNGVGTRYGLGVSVSAVSGHRQLEHSGEVSGFTADNIVLPDDGIAVAALTNQDAAPAGSQIARKIRDALLERRGKEDATADALMRRVFDDLRAGKIDRTLLTDNANAYFTEQAIKDFRESLAPLGDVKSFSSTGSQGRGGMIHRGYEVKLAQKSVGLNIYQMPDGKIEQFLVVARE